MDFNYRKLNRIVCAIALQFLSTTAFSQFDNNITYVPPSPTASALVKSVNTPVNMNTGIADITADLCTISARGGYQIPIYLSYHGGGVKVQEVSTTVGLGWNISANMMITRVVRGLPDEGPNGFFGSDMGAKISTPMDIPSIEGVAKGDKDGEPDLFYVKINGRAFRFTFSYSGNPVYLDDNSIRILNSPFKQELGQNGWVLEDLDGNTYYFGGDVSSTEETQTILHGETSDRTIPTFTSTWYINKITTTNSIENISFSYEPGGSISIKNYSRRKKTYNKITQSFKRGFYYFGVTIWPDQHTSDIEFFSNEWDNSVEETIASPKYLASITTTNESAYFSYSPTLRQDLTNARALNKIEVKNYKGESLKSFVFNQSYWNTDEGQPVVAQDKYRLKLTSVTLYNRTQTASIPLFGFEYNENTLLPPRNSSQTDHWGYYNKNIEGDFITDIKNIETYKTPDRKRMQANILKKIKYPTGGYKSFVYETNDYYDQINGKNVDGGGLRIANIISVGDMNSPPVEQKYSYRDDLGHSTGLQMVSEPIYITYLQHTTSQTPFVPLGLPNPPDNTLEPSDSAIPSNVKGCLVIPIRYTPNLKGALTFAVVQLATSIISPGQSFSSVSYTPFTTVSSTSYNNLFDINGNNIIYSQVTQENAGEGKTVNKFTDSNDYPDLVNQMSITGNTFDHAKRIATNIAPFTPPTSYAFARGFLKESSVYDKNGVLLKRITNTYELKPLGQDVGGFRSGIVKINTNTNLQFQSISSTTYNIGYYQMISKKLVLKTSKVESFEPGLAAVYSTTSYQYDQTYPSLVTFQTTINSDGSNSSADYKYVVNKDAVPYDTPNEISAASSLYTNGRFGLLLQSSFRKNNYILDKTTIGYKNWVINNKQLLLPEFVHKESQNAFFLARQYFAYDEFGNPIKLSRENGPAISTRWDYNSLFPVSEMMNADPAESFFEGFETLSSGAVSSSTSHSGSNCYLGDYPLNFSIPNGRSYKFSYWYLDVGKWVFSGYLPYSGPVSLSLGDAIDDVVVIPRDASISTSTFKPGLGITSRSGPTRAAMTYCYDDYSRLTDIKNDQGDIIKHYGFTDSSPAAANLFLSAPIYASMTKNCTGNSTRVYYEIKEGKYTSYNSQLEADQQAENELLTQGQAYADTYAKCLPTIGSPTLSCRTGGNCNDNSGCSVRYVINYYNLDPSKTYTSTTANSANSGASAGISNFVRNGTTATAYVNYSESSGSGRVDFDVVLYENGVAVDSKYNYISHNSSFPYIPQCQ
ncbi:hypothetical protein GS399_05225 [Pedobacter sp. HMF7647]|uniref:DUF5977 domain-containing protein n=1 Tax=Hufsiella arboris TaxID=2695275 RepID=A0A7K1Y716_9SPHI|nr:DUF5977 domain-containing protein [Hufsiella arboris]MXV50366.1 hypothetical protein [Hufsiella arboris]